MVRTLGLRTTFVLVITKVVLVVNKSSENLINIEKNEELIREVLEVVEKDDNLTQRTLSSKLGIALGLANTYLKRCVEKGLIKIQHAPRNRYLYYLTPKGFSEKARLTGEYLKYSFDFYRKAKKEYIDIIDYCHRNGFRKVVLSDLSELAEISILASYDTSVKIVGILGKRKSNFFGAPVSKNIKIFGKYDIILLTTIIDIDNRYAELLKHTSKDKIIIPEMLGKGMNRNIYD